MGTAGRRVGGQELANVAAGRLELRVRHAEAGQRAIIFQRRLGSDEAPLAVGAGSQGGNRGRPGLEAGDQRQLAAARAGNRRRPAYQWNLAIAPRHGGVGLAHVAQEQAVAREVNREDLREARRRLQPVEEGRRRGCDEIALAAEADPFRHQPARGYERQRLRPLVLAEGHELVGQRIQPVIRHHSPQGQFRPGREDKVVLRKVRRDVIALRGNPPRAAQPRQRAPPPSD